LIDLAIALVVLVAIGPLTIHGVRLARKHRRIAFAASTLLLLFGVNSNVAPPPPPKIEAVEREEEQAADDEPK